MKSILKIIVIGFFAGLLGAYTLLQFTPVPNQEVLLTGDDTYNNPLLVREIPDVNEGANISVSEDFVEASRISTKSVVYIRSLSEKSYSLSWMDLFFGGQPNREVRVSSGSGVIFSKDGYIVSNNHVIAGADKVEVIFNRQAFEAKVVGTDPGSDLAVLKIEAENLPVIPMGTSKDVQVGEWVIAVGNPFNLTSTVTAGIVSAKGRQINILKEKFPIESFIQTDAAINPGNSGGALVDSEGKLVGINTAIFSAGTGSYVGYGFAVPVDIVRKVFSDIVRYGEVQKAFFGGEVEDFTSDIAKRLDIKRNGDFTGVLLVYLREGGAAAKAGLIEGDIITAIDGTPINSKGNFEEELSYRSPGEKIMVTYERKGKVSNSSLTLTNREGTTEILKRKTYISESLGAEFEEVSKVERDVLGIKNGIRVFNIKRGKLYGIEEDFIITNINKVAITSATKLIEILENVDGIVYIEGVNKNGRRGRYRFYGQ